MRFPAAFTAGVTPARSVRQNEILISAMGSIPLLGAPLRPVVQSNYPINLDVCQEARMKIVKKSQTKSARLSTSTKPAKRANVAALRQAVRARTKIRLVRGYRKPATERDTDASKS